jgi:hypothetical protein
MHGVENTLAAVEGLPPVRLEIDDDRTWAGVRVRTRLAARGDLRRGRVHVNVPTERIPALRRRFASSRATANGIVFDHSDAQGHAEALAAARRP